MTKNANDKIWPVTGDISRSTIGSDNLSGSGLGPTLEITSVSQDQIDLSWTASAGMGILIERSTSSGGPFSTVYFADEETQSVKLFSHQPNTEYFFRARRISPAGVGSYGGIESDTTSAAIGTLYVDTAGNDTTGDGSIGSPYASIQKAHNESAPGYIININAGTYKESSFTPLGANPEYFSRPTGIYLSISGTATDPIIIQATTGDAVVIDQEYDALGFYTGSAESAGWADYIHIKDLEMRNCYHSAICMDDNGSNEEYDAPLNQASRGWVVENVRVYDTGEIAPGVNSAGMRLDSTRDLIVRNCIIDEVRYASNQTFTSPTWIYVENTGCILTYNQYDALVEFNQFSNCYNGWYVKNLASNIPTKPNIANTMRYNTFDNHNNAFQFNANNDAEDRQYHKMSCNIIKNVASMLYSHDSNDARQFLLRNNFVDYGTRGPSSPSISTGVAISIAGGAANDRELEITGNIFNNSSSDVNYAMNDTGNTTDIQEMNANVYVNGPNARFRYGALITNLATWQSTTDAQISDNDLDNGAISNQALNTVATNAGANDYTLPSGSNAISLLADGTNAGPYRYGNNTIIGNI